MSQQEPKNDQADLEAINQVRKAHIAALNAGDVNAWAATFTEDGVQMPPNAPGNFGRESIRVWSQAFIAPFRVEFKLAVDELRLLGDWAFERGAYTVNLTPKAGGQPVRDVGKYVTIYERKPGGSWGMARDIWNSNNPQVIQT